MDLRAPIQSLPPDIQRRIRSMALALHREGRCRFEEFVDRTRDDDLRPAPLFHWCLKFSKDPCDILFLRRGPVSLKVVRPYHRTLAPEPVAGQYDDACPSCRPADVLRVYRCGELVDVSPRLRGVTQLPRLILGPIKCRVTMVFVHFNGWTWRIRGAKDHKQSVRTEHAFIEDVRFVTGW